jgi:hypothetical protein
MRDVVSPLAEEIGLVLDERDVRSDPEWHELYRNDIPILLLEGREVARHRVTAEGLRARLRELLPE